MLTIARFQDTLRLLNYSVITDMDRQNAEMYYLSRIAKQLAAAPESEETNILAEHRRWGALCKLHGAPRIDRAADMEKRNLSANLIELEFLLAGATQSTIKRVPKSLSVSALKALLGRMFGMEPLWLQLELVPEGEEGSENLLLEDGIKDVAYYVERKKGQILVKGRV